MEKRIVEYLIFVFLSKALWNAFVKIFDFLRLSIGNALMKISKGRRDVEQGGVWLAIRGQGERNKEGSVLCH